jgi:hypothetical protein
MDQVSRWMYFLRAVRKKSNGAEYSAGRFYFYCAAHTAVCEGGVVPHLYTYAFCILIVCIYEHYV